MTAAASTDVSEPGLGRRLLDIATERPVLTAFIVALMIRFAIAIFLTRFFSGTLVLDDTTYHGMIESMAAGETAHWDDYTRTLYWSAAALSGPVTLLYKLFGPTMLIGQLYVGLTGALAVAAGTRLALEVMPRRFALGVGFALAFLPSQAFWSSMLMKDAPVWMTLTALAVLVAAGNRTTGRRLALFGVAAAGVLVVLSYLRLHTLVVAAFALMLASLFGRKEGRVVRVLGAVAVGVLVPWLVGGIGPAGLELATNAGSLEDRRFLNAVGANTAVVDVPAPEAEPSLPPASASGGAAAATALEKKERLEARTSQLESQLQQAAPTPAPPRVVERKQERLERLEEQIAVLDAVIDRLAEEGDDREDVLDEPAIPDPTDLEGEGLAPELAYLPRGISVMLIEPFPIPFTGSVSLRLARAESLVWYPLLLLALVGLVQAFKHRQATAFPILAGGAILVMYSLTEGNIGTAHRHRGEFVWVVVLLAGMGWHHLARRRRAAAQEHAVAGEGP